MKIAYITESRVYLRTKDADSSEAYDIHAIVTEATAVKTARDFVAFMVNTPFSFFAKTARIIDGVEQAYDLDDTDYYGEDGHPFSGSIVDAVYKYFDDIEVLDRYALVHGALGSYNALELYDPDDEGKLPGEVYGNGEFVSFYVQIGEMVIRNVRSLAKFAAIANGEPSPNGLRRISVEGIDFAQVVSSGFSTLTDFHDHHVQDPPMSSYFTEEDLGALLAAAESSGLQYDKHRERLVDDSHSVFDETLFVYPSDMSDRDIAANMFESFVNSLFEGDAMTYYVGNTYKVRFDGERFKVLSTRSPFRELYQEVAKDAEDRNFRICSWCGDPILADKSRGNEAMYCSRSCNTKASNARRETAYALAASGAPIEDAINKIGERYSDSITRWYKEAKALIS